MKKEDIDSGTPSLYEWQRECLAAWEQNGRHGIVHVVTGAGKTFLALAAIERTRREYPDLMVRIVVPTIPLARQWETELLHHIGPEAWRPGFFGGGARDDPDRHVMIYVINSARDSLAGHIRRDLALQKHVLLICDECHHYQSRENRKIFNFLKDMDCASVSATFSRSVNGPAEPPPDSATHRPGAATSTSDPVMPGSGPAASSPAPLCFTLGLSATPFGTPDDSILIRSLGPEIYRYGFDTAVREGIISPFTVCEVSASFFADEMDAYALLTEKIRQVLARLFAAYPKLKGMGEREFLRAVTRIARESDMDPEEPATAFLLLTYQRKEISSLARARTAMLRRIQERMEAVRETGRSGGMIFTGRYGEGKTHLLNTAFNMASAENMVVSFVSLGKETPVDKPYLLYPKIVANTYLPGAAQPGFRQKLEDLTQGSSISGELLAYAAKELETDKLYFLLKAFLGTQEEDERYAFLADLEGDFTTGQTIKRSYRRITGAVAKFNQNFSKTKHGFDYFCFLSHLFRQLGYAGWVLLFDEAELIGGMGKKARAKSYVEIQRFLRPSPKLEGVFSLFAFSSSYVEDVIDKKKEEENVQTTYAEDPDALTAATATVNAILNAPELEDAEEL